MQFPLLQRCPFSKKKKILVLRPGTHVSLQHRSCFPNSRRSANPSTSTPNLTLHHIVRISPNHIACSTRLNEQSRRDQSVWRGESRDKTCNINCPVPECMPFAGMGSGSDIQIARFLCLYCPGEILSSKQITRLARLITENSTSLNPWNAEGSPSAAGRISLEIQTRSMECCRIVQGPHIAELTLRPRTTKDLKHLEGLLHRHG